MGQGIQEQLRDDVKRKFSTELLQQELRKIMSEFPKPERNIRVYTGVGGFDLFDEAVDTNLGYYRIYLTKKPLRLLRRLKGEVYKSATDRYFKRFKTKTNEELRTNT